MHLRTSCCWNWLCPIKHASLSDRFFPQGEPNTFRCLATTTWRESWSVGQARPKLGKDHRSGRSSYIFELQNSSQLWNRNSLFFVFSTFFSFLYGHHCSPNFVVGLNFFKASHKFSSPSQHTPVGHSHSHMSHSSSDQCTPLRSQ
jgi:hypothetical protein